MNILIDIGHPAHVHLLKYTARELEAHGHKIFYSVRDIPVAKHLMDIYGMPYIDLGGKKDSLFGKMKTVLSQDWKMWRFVRKHKIDIGLSSGIVQAHVSKFSKMKAFIFDDDDDAVEPLEVKYAHPYCDVVFTPEEVKRKTEHAVYYPGNHQLAHLHPKRFTPDPSVLAKAGLKEGEKFFLMRFVAFKGHHDVGHHGLGFEEKKKLVAELEKHGRVIITFEREIDPAFEKYRLPVPAEDIHSLMYYSSMFIGDSQTMTREAALLGVPTLKCNTFAGKLAVSNRIDGADLEYSYQPEDFDKLFAKLQELLAKDNLKEEWVAKRDKYLEQQIDPTAFFVWFIENYPESKRQLDEDPKIFEWFK